ncbi:MAG: DNA-methyltransferase [Sulfobacillus sp.]
MNRVAPGIWQGDAQAAASLLPPGAIDLIYLDPPFGTGRLRQGPAGAYGDQWRGAVSHVDWLTECCRRLWPALRQGGTLWLHLDARSVHHMRVALDQLWADGTCRNEVVWCYNGGGVPKRDFSRKHDLLLRYVKGANWTFHMPRRPYKANTQAIGRHSTRARQVTIDLERGTPETDWWTDIPTVTGWSGERLGYPTQKPLALLSRLITATSNRGDLVADLFMGSGTTLAAAASLGRRYFGVDSSPAACDLAATRLAPWQAAAWDWSPQ